MIAECQKNAIQIFCQQETNKHLVIDYVFSSAILRPSYGNDNQTGRKTA